MPSDDMGKDLRADVGSAWRVALEASAKGPLNYLQYVVIDCKPEPSPYRKVAEDWQWALAQRFAPSFSYVAGLSPKPPLRRYWMTLPKGNDKSSFIARMTNWALAFAKKSWSGYVAAADRDQAKLILDAMRTEASLNPWLDRRLEFGNWLVKGANGSHITILAADAMGSQGLRPDLLICDEVTHWVKKDFYDNLKSGIDKKDAVFIVITNAGIKYSWQHDELVGAQQSPYWWVYEAPGQLASWMDEASIADLSRGMPAMMARRLYKNEWVDPGEASGYLTRSEIAKGLETGQRYNLQYSLAAQQGVRYVASIDYGAVRDRCVKCVMHMTKDGTVLLDRMDVEQGSRVQPVAIESVERWLDDVRREYPLDVVVVDPYQMESTIQRYQGKVPIERWEPRGGKANYEMAQAFRTSLVNGRLGWYHKAGALMVTDRFTGLIQEEAIEDELLMLQLKQMAYGFRVEHLPDRHDDRFVAFAMGAVWLIQQRMRRDLPKNDCWF